MRGEGSLLLWGCSGEAPTRSPAPPPAAAVSPGPRAAPGQRPGRRATGRAATCCRRTAKPTLVATAPPLKRQTSLPSHRSFFNRLVRKGGFTLYKRGSDRLLIKLLLFRNTFIFMKKALWKLYELAEFQTCRSLTSISHQHWNACEPRDKILVQCSSHNVPQTFLPRQKTNLWCCWIIFQ